jgi:septal ring factor EnvC (AmiA/AmiB activator)
MSSEFRVDMGFGYQIRKSAYFLLLVFFIACFSISAQTREELEQRRLELKQEIRKINDLLIGTRKKEKSILAQVTDLNQRIKATENLIAVINREANLLTDEIASNKEKIEKLEKELEALKEDYAQMIRRSHRSSSKQNRMMFLFSSESFLQAYKRLRYMKQYADYRREQGEKIKETAVELESLNADLIKQRKAKENLLAEKKNTREKLESDKKKQQALVAEVMKKEDAFANQIYQKQQEIDKIDRQIDALVRAAIAEENAKKGSTKRNAFEMTPKAAALAADFESNKGKLPWPVERGIVTMSFGTHPHPVVSTTTINSSGVRISTGENAEAKAVFGGVVSEIQSIRGAHMAVMIRHGNYITVYNNLSNVYVKKGQEVTIGQALGQVSESTATGKATLYFLIYKNMQKLDPADWIYKM